MQVDVLTRLRLDEPIEFERFLFRCSPSRIASNADGTLVAAQMADWGFSVYCLRLRKFLYKIGANEVLSIDSGKIVSRRGSVIRTLDMASGGELCCFNTKRCDDGLAASADGSLVASTDCRDTGATWVWNVFKASEKIAEFRSVTIGCGAVFTRDSKRMVIGDDNGVWIWGLETDERVLVKSSHVKDPTTPGEISVVALAIDRSDCYLAFNGYKRIEILDLTEMRLTESIPTDNFNFRLVGFIRGFVVAAFAREIVAWEPRSWKESLRLPWKAEIVDCILTEEEKLVVRDEDNDVSVLELVTS